MRWLLVVGLMALFGCGKDGGSAIVDHSHAGPGMDISGVWERRIYTDLPNEDGERVVGVPEIVTWAFAPIGSDGVGRWHFEVVTLASEVDRLRFDFLRPRFQSNGYYALPHCEGPECIGYTLRNEGRQADVVTGEEKPVETPKTDRRTFVQVTPDVLSINGVDYNRVGDSR